MSTIDEVLAAAEVVDAVCVIDGETRIISVPAEYKELGVESDEKVTRVKFQCPKIVGDNIDLTECNLYINYRNAGNKLNSYLVEDVTVTGDTINFSWLLSRHVTESPGTISYIVCAKKSDDTGVINEWNTKVATGIVGIGLEATEEIEEQNIDAIEQILRSIVELENKVDSGGIGGSSIAIDETLTQTGQAADAAAVGNRLSALSEEIADKANKVGWTPDKYIGTDAGGNLVVKDAPAGGGSGTVTSINGNTPDENGNVKLTISLDDITDAKYTKTEKNPDILSNEDAIEYVNTPIWTTTFRATTYATTNAENPYIAKRVSVTPNTKYVLYRDTFAQAYVNGGIVFFASLESDAPLYGIFSWDAIRYNDGTNSGVDASSMTEKPYIVTPTDGSVKYVIFTVPDGCTALQINISKANDMSYIPQICEGTSPEPLKTYVAGYSEVYKMDGCELADRRLRARRPFRDYKWGILGDSISAVGSLAGSFYYQNICAAEGWEYQSQAGNGHKISDISSQVNLLEDVDFITMFIGTNNWEDYVDNIGTPTDTSDSFCADFAQVLSTVKTKFPTVPLIVITPMPRFDDATANERVREIANAEQAVCEHYSIPCVNLFKSGGLYNNDTLIAYLYNSDKLHPNRNGHIWITPIIHDAICRAIN